MTGPEGNFVSQECFLWRSQGKHWDLTEKKFTVPQVICCIAKQNKGKFWKMQAEIPVTTSCYLQQQALITCSSCQHFSGNSELLPNFKLNSWSHWYRQLKTLTLTPHSESHTRGSHQLKFLVKYFLMFFPKTIGGWNCLPEAIVSSTSLESFKCRLSAF